MTVTDRTDATDAEFEARLERLDRLEVADVGADVEDWYAAMVVLAALPISIPGYSSETVRRATAHLADALAAARAEGARAAIDALKPPPPDGGDVR